MIRSTFYHLLSIGEFLVSFILRAFRVFAPALVLTSSVVAQVPVVFEIDSQLSSLEIQPGVLPPEPFGIVTEGSRLQCNQPIAEQFPDSLRSFFGGTLQASRAGDTLTFSGGSFIEALENPGQEFEPLIGEAGTTNTIDNFGGRVHPDYGDYLNVAIRNAIVDITSGSVTIGTAPSNMTSEFTNGSLEFFFVLASPQVDFFDLQPSIEPFPNQSTLDVTESGGTLTIPLRFDVFLDDDSGVICGDENLPNRIVLSGQIVATPMAGLTCDFDGDGNCDLGDIDSLYDNLGSTNATFNLDGLGVVDNDDVTEWLAQASLADPMGRTFVRGDGNLDGNVGGTDFTTLAVNFGDPGGWSQGNFIVEAVIGGGNVGGPDFTALAFNFGFTSPVSATPEPTGLTPVFLGLVFSILLGRRRSSQSHCLVRSMCHASPPRPLPRPTLPEGG